VGGPCAVETGRTPLACVLLWYFPRAFAAQGNRSPGSNGGKSGDPRVKRCTSRSSWFWRDAALLFLAWLVATPGLLASAQRPGAGLVAILEPRPEAILVGPQVVRVALDPGAARTLAGLECRVDGRLVGHVSSPPFEFRFDAGPTPEAHTIEVIATYEGTKSASAQVTTRALKVDLDASVREVLLPVSVTDREQRFQAGLRREDFRAFDGALPVEIKDLWPVELPLRLAILLDASSSMHDRIAGARKVFDALVGELHSGDSASLSSFLAEPKLLIPMGRPLADLLRAGDEMRVSHVGFTGLYDSAEMVLREQFATPDAESAPGIVVLTDGLDTVSQKLPEAIAQEALRLGVPLFVVAVRSPEDGGEHALPSDERLAHRRLADWVAAARGRALFTTSGRDLDTALREMLRDLRSRTMLSLVPQEGHDSIGQLRVEVLRPDLTVWTPPEIPSAGGTASATR
jgi:von Willebrand factor type A domain-containing protein